MDADRPVTSREHDRLGFAPVAEHLATVIADASAKDGLVLGIEGAWGSGKSSIISLTKEALRKKANALEVVDFAPWLVGARNTLLGGLFDELAAAAAKIDPIPAAVEAEDTRSELHKLFDRTWNDQHWKLRQKEALKKKLGSQLEVFGALAGTAGRAAKVASEFGVQGRELPPAEPLHLHRHLADVTLPEADFLRMARLHQLLLAVSIITLFGAVGVSHGLF